MLGATWSALWSVLCAIWRFLDRIGWVIAIALVAFALIKLHHDEQATKKTAAHTKLVQQQGGPVAVCLLDALHAVEPLLVKLPKAYAPLSEYYLLQSVRYPGVTCPDNAGKPAVRH